MPLPRPRSGEPTKAFISRCISFATDEGMPSNVAVAACYSQARRAGRSVPRPKKEETCKDYTARVGAQSDPDLLEDRLFNDRFMDPGYMEHHSVALGSLEALEAEIMEIEPPKSYAEQVEEEQQLLRQP